MTNKYRNLGVIGATGNKHIDRDAIVIDQIFEKDGRTSLSLSISEFETKDFPAGSTLDVLVKDNKTNQRENIIVGDVHHIDVGNISEALPRQLDPKQSQFFIKVVAPDLKILAQSDTVRLSGGDSGVDGAGNDSSSRSPIHTRIDDEQILPCVALLKDEYPLISFGKYGPQSTGEIKNDLGAVAYAIPGAIEKFVRALLDEDGDKFVGECWDGLRANIASTLGKKSWADLHEEHANMDPAEAAEQIATEYFKEGKLIGLSEKLLNIKNSENEGE